jgi:outer membrane protein OmpA-like peptidoglycan-associated protein
MISGMFTAIRDFVQDSFGTDPGEELDDLKVGRRTVWVRQEPKAVLAAVINGSAPAAFRTTLQAALAKIHAEHCEALESFDGDTSRFEPVAPLLKSLLARSEKAPPPAGAGAPGEGGEGAGAGAGGKSKRKVPVPLLVVTTVVLAALAAWVFHSRRQAARWDRYVAWLKAQPGVVVLDARRVDGRYVVTGLRDPDADPARQLADHLEVEHLAPRLTDFHFQPYQSLSPQLAPRRRESDERRVASALRPPPTARLSLSPEGILSATGTAPADWLATARAVAPALPGVTRLDTTGLAVAADPALLKKAEHLLRPPTGVELRLTQRPTTGPADGEGEVLIAMGPAPHAWIEQAERLAPLLPGVSRFDPSGLTDVDGDDAIRSRAAAALQLPGTVQLKAANGVLSAAGRATHDWVLRARRTATDVPGVLRYDDSALADADLEQISKLRRAVESARVRFVRYNSELPADQGGALDAVAGDVRQLLAAADAIGMSLDVRVVGHTDWVGTEEGKMHVSQLRAQNVASALAARRVPPRRLPAVGVGDRDPIAAKPPAVEPAQGDRSQVGRTAADQLVTFEVVTPEAQKQTGSHTGGR